MAASGIARQSKPTISWRHRASLGSRKIFVEYNGLAFHSGASAVAHDNERTTALAALRWRGLFFDETTPERRIVEKIKEALL
jgi:hypothetical protein